MISVTCSCVAFYVKDSKILTFVFEGQPKTKQKDKTLSSQSILIAFLSFIQGILDHKSLTIALKSGQTCVKLMDFLSK